MITNSPNNILVYNCNFCNYKTSNKKDYNKHLATPKHTTKSQILQNTTTDTTKSFTHKTNKKYNCLCGKEYKHHSSLWNHKKNCSVVEKITEETPKNTEENIIFTTEEIGENPELSGPVNTTMILELLKQNNEFKELLIEQNKKILELVGNSSVTNNITNNNTMNNKFNLQIFLNEKCKDAYNIDEFIQGVNVGFKDFENFGKIGYVSSINHILIRELKEIDIYKRPIHCSDLKREVIHVKDNNVWVKDEGKKYMKKAILAIEHKNIQLIPEYAKAYPEVRDNTTKRSDEYDKMMYNAMGEYKDEDNERNYEKIIRTVAKEILIDKEK